MTMFADTRRTTPTTYKTIVAISDCYDIKDALKVRGYGWNAMCKRWEKVAEDPIEEMTQIFVEKLGTVEDYEKLYTTGVLYDGYDFSDDQYNRICEAIAPEC